MSKHWNQTLGAGTWLVCGGIVPKQCFQFTILLLTAGFELISSDVLQHATGSRQCFADVPPDVTMVEIWRY
jgi:hypothetical protein